MRLTRSKPSRNKFFFVVADMRHRSALCLSRFLAARSPSQISQISTSRNLLNSLGQLSPDSVPFSWRSSLMAKPALRFGIFSHPCSTRRKFSTEPLDLNKEVDEINLKFAEAREEIEMAMESKETVYFDEEAECARAAVKEAVEMFEGLLLKLSESEKAAVQRSMGLKIEQLKAELQQLND